MKQVPDPATSQDQLELVPVPRCEYCGPLSWAIEQFGRETHKCGCPYRIHSYCQAHPVLCDEFTDIRNPAWRNSPQKRELPGETWEHIFGDAA